TAGAGSHTITYTANGCSASQAITVKALPTLAAFTAVCVDAGPFALTGGAPVGGVYSGPGVTTPAQNGTANYQFNPATAGAGSHTITYTANGCSASQAITVKALPTLAAFTAVCVDAAAFNLSGGLPTGGVYSGPGVTLVSGTTYQFNPATAGTGNKTITYTVNGCSASQTLTVKALPTLTAFSDVCANANAFVLTGGAPTGGVYSGPGVTLVSGTTYQFNPAAAGFGTYTITYTVNGCSASRSINVKEISLAAFSDVCASASAFVLTGGAPTGGVYSGPGVSLVDGKYQLNPAVGGTGSRTITYTVNGCSATQNVNVKAISLTAFGDVCANDAAFDLSGGAPAGGVYSGTGVSLVGGSGKYRFTPSVGSGTYLITYSVNGCSISQSITVKPVPTLTAFSPICQGTSRILSGGAPTGGIYSSPTAGAVTQPSAGTYVFNAAKTLGAGTYQITYQAPNGCSVSQSITVVATPTLTAFNDMCQTAAAITLTGGAPAVGADGINGVYSGPGVSFSGGVYRFTPSAAGAGTHTISYTTSCGVASRPVTVIATPTLAPFAKPVCTNGTLALTGGAPAGGTWSGPGVTGSTFSAAAALLIGPGPYIITYTTGCGTASQPLTVTNTTTWTGAVSNNWFDANNWTACVPDPTINGIVPVPSGSRPYPVISGATGEVLTLTVSGKWTLPSGNLDLYGDFDTSGGGTFKQDAGTFTLKGINQAIAGATFYNLTSGTTGIKSLTGNVSVTNLLNMQAGIMETSMGYMVDLGTSGGISESDASYVLGRVRAIRTVPLSGVQPFGGIGLSLAVNSGQSTGITTVMRVTGPNTAQTGLPGSTSILRYFDVSAAGVNLTSPPLDLTATFGYREMELNGITESNLALFRSTNNGASWGQVRGIISESANNFSGARLTSLGRLTLGDRGLPLPVSLMSFAAKRQQQTTLLTWSTASEKNNEGFSVETSHNGVSFQPIGFVKSLASNSQTVQTYSFVDRANRPAGVQYYRLQQVDLDGKAGYSPVQTVVVQPGGTQMAAYPNPFHGTLSVDVSLVAASPVTIIMHDALGREVYRTTTRTLPTGMHTLQVTPDSKAQGMYMLNISIGNGPTQHIRVVQQ
uniref:T9SS type A sorting domain-containing protein n=1 Tax=Hymenobacter sp. BT730 TaxID=3063332 RepID=UPI0026DFB662